MHRVLLFALLGALAPALHAQAPVPATIAYQGVLTNASGTPVPDGAYTVQLRLFPAATGGAAVYAEVHTVNTTGGVFAAALGAGTPVTGTWANVDFDRGYWLETAVGGTTLAPRTRLLTSPYARSLTPGARIGAPASGPALAAAGVIESTAGGVRFPDGTTQATAAAPFALPFAGSTGSGTTALSATHTAASGATAGVYGESASPNGFGLRGDAPYVGVYGTGDNTGVWGQAEGTGQNWGVYGETASAAGTGVYGGASSTSGTTYGVYGESASPGGRGLFGRASATNGDARGVYGETASTGGRGVQGYASATSGTTRGVLGMALSPSGVGVYGLAAATSGTPAGVYGESFSSTGRGLQGYASATSGINIGVYGETASTSGYGVFGWASATSGGNYGTVGRSDSPGGAGVYGVNLSPGGRGVWGLVTATSGTSYGVYGEASATSGGGYGGYFLSNSPNGGGVRGWNSATSGEAAGVIGRSDSPSGKGVFGIHNSLSGNGSAGYFVTDASHGRGVVGFGSYSGVGSHIGVYGTITSSSSGGWAGYFLYRVHVQGVLSKSAGSFRIDHPLDPENRTLSHSFVESPDMMNVYNGNVTTDVHGYAAVELPDYFAALNRDFRYQLTTLGSFSRAMIAERISGNRFVIRTEEPNVDVSWQVTGIRQDAYAREFPIVVEEWKRLEERGRYLNPEAFGLPRERGIVHFPEDERARDEAGHTPVEHDLPGGEKGYRRMEPELLPTESSPLRLHPEPPPAGVERPLRER